MLTDTVKYWLAVGAIMLLMWGYSGKIGTAHVGLAYRTNDGVLRFMHASSPRNHGQVVLDQQLSGYLNKFRSHAGILVARPLR